MSEQEAYDYLMTYDLTADEVEEWVAAMATVITGSEHGEVGRHRAQES